MAKVPIERPKGKKPGKAGQRREAKFWEGEMLSNAGTIRKPRIKKKRK